MMHTELGDDERNTGIPIHHPGLTIRQKGKHPLVLPSGKTSSTKQTYSAVISIYSPRCSNYMKIDSQDDVNIVELVYTEPEDTDIKKLKQEIVLTDADDPKRGACSRSNESCKRSTVGVTELRHDDKGNINLPQAETEHLEWKTGGQFRPLPPGNIATPAHLHFPF